MSSSHLTRDEYSALSSLKQKQVCDTRAYIKKLDEQQGVISEVGQYVHNYLAPAELERVTKAEIEYLLRLSRAKGR